MMIRFLSVDVRYLRKWTKIDFYGSEKNFHPRKYVSRIQFRDSNWSNNAKSTKHLFNWFTGGIVNDTFNLDSTFNPFKVVMESDRLRILWNIFSE
jgi:hypothetical protein